MAINDFRYCMCLNDPDPAAQKHYKAAILKNSRWQPGDKISIRFLDGDPALQQRVKNVALEWTKVANLVFDFVNRSPADIRIAFTQGNGSWS